jgi:hypothetical protein
MQHFENKSRTWYKVTSYAGRSVENIHEKWPLPAEDKKGEWYSSPSQLGTMLVTNPKPFFSGVNRVFIAELDKDAPVVEIAGVVWVKKARLVREANGKELAQLSMFRSFGPLF